MKPEVVNGLWVVGFVITFLLSTVLTWLGGRLFGELQVKLTAGMLVGAIALVVVDLLVIGGGAFGIYYCWAVLQWVSGFVAFVAGLLWLVILMTVFFRGNAKRPLVTSDDL